MTEKTELNWNSSRTFICVDYPGMVRNTDKMLETIGGAETLTRIYHDRSLRLPLKLRPDNVFCKPMYGDQTNVARILFKVKRKKQKASKDEIANASSSSSACQVEMLGIVDVTYKFKSMADFQLLPMERVGKSDDYRPFYDEVVPQMMLPAKWLVTDSPSFLPSTVFSRMDDSSDYDFRKDSVINPDLTEEENGAAVASRMGHNYQGRRKRCGYAVYANYESKTLPDRPLEGCITHMYAKGITKDEAAKIKEAFEERPIWSKLALRARLKVSGSRIGFLLPSVAFYMLTGPWRSLWIKYGYDPRKLPEAKLYQMVDLRLKKFGESIPLFSKWRGNLYGAAAKLTPHILEKAAVIHKEDLCSKETDQNPNSTQEVEKSKYSFYSGMLPSRRQSIWQFCDIYVDEVQKMVHEDGQEEQCTEKEGWFPEGFVAKCRKLLVSDIDNTLKSLPNATDTQISEGDSSSDDLDDE